MTRAVADGLLRRLDSDHDEIVAMAGPAPDTRPSG